MLAMQSLGLAGYNAAVMVNGAIQFINDDLGNVEDSAFLPALAS